MSNVAEILNKIQEKFTKSIENFQSSVMGINVKANRDMLNAITVEVYGSKTPINQVANISVLDNRTLSVTAYEASTANLINKAVQAANLGFGVVTEGAVTRVTMPAPTEEGRKKLVALIAKTCDDQKVAIRNIRREGNELVKALLKNKVISEDEAKKGEDKIQKLTDESQKLLESLADKKSHEVQTM